MSDTPRTDAAVFTVDGDPQMDAVPAELARELERALSEVTRQRDEFIGDRNRFAAELRELRPYAGACRDALREITDHLAAVMGGPMVAGRGVTFQNGVEGIPTIKRAREVLQMDTSPNPDPFVQVTAARGRGDDHRPDGAGPQKDNASFRAAGECDHEWLPIPPNVNGFPGDALCQKCGKAGKREAAPVTRTASTPDDEARWREINLMADRITYGTEPPSPLESALCWAVAKLREARIATGGLPPQVRCEACSVMNVLPRNNCINCCEPLAQGG